MGVGACIPYDVYHGCGYLCTGENGCILIQVCVYNLIINADACVWLHIDVGTCVQLYHECMYLCMALHICRYVFTVVL